MRATEVTGAHNYVTARVVDATIHIVYATVRNEERKELRDLEAKATNYRFSRYYMLGMFVIVPGRDHLVFFVFGMRIVAASIVVLWKSDIRNRQCFVVQMCNNGDLGAKS